MHIDTCTGSHIYAEIHMAHVHTHICMSHIQQQHTLFAHTHRHTTHTTYTHSPGYPSGTNCRACTSSLLPTSPSPFMSRKAKRDPSPCSTLPPLVCSPAGPESAALPFQCTPLLQATLPSYADSSFQGPRSTVDRGRAWGMVGQGGEQGYYFHFTDQ